MPVIPERTKEGKFIPYYNEAMVVVSAKVPKSISERLKQLTNKGEFLRETIIKAVEDLDNAE